MARRNQFLILASSAALAGAVGLMAQQEHPLKEHPQKEHPTKEHPSAKPLSTATLEKAIVAHVGEKAKEAGGKFHLKDDVLGKTWALDLVRVHTDKLTQLDDKTYFACVDFKADDGTIVDVDFYLKDSSGKLKVSDTTVHKLNGKPRYNYQQKGSYWERVKVGG